MNEEITKSAIIKYLEEFHSKRDYFECHEILEHVWQQDKIGSRKVYLAALIQISVAMYHYRRSNFVGATKLFIMAKEKVYNDMYEFNKVGFDADKLIHLINSILLQLKNKVPYTSQSIPMQPNLLNEYIAYCEKNDINPFKTSDISNEYLVNRHEQRFR